LAVGFETTAATIASAVMLARNENLKNLLFFSSMKLIPPAMEYLLQDKRLKLSGFLCPGHVSTIIGTKPYEIIAKKYSIGCCVAGFEPLDILEGIYLLVSQIVRKRPRVDNQYIRVVKKSGNLKAQNVIRRALEVSSAQWRGIGAIPQSGLRLNYKYRAFCAERVLKLKPLRAHTVSSRKCRCAEVLKGLISPLECPSFSRACCPDNPLGPCMVSKEGVCNAHYRYNS
jgi:hydrogenase expression/formation protein HypD